MCQCYIMVLWYSVAGSFGPSLDVLSLFLSLATYTIKKKNFQLLDIQQGIVFKLLVWVWDGLMSSEN